MQAIIKLPEDLVDDSKYVIRSVKGVSKKSIIVLLESLCDEFAYDYPEEFEFISVITSDNEIMLTGVDF